MVGTADKYYLGYPMDIMAVVQYALTHIPDYRNLIKSQPFNIWEMKVLYAVTGILGNRAGIPDLAIVAVWIGGGRQGFCWFLPDRFWREPLEETDAKALKKLQTLLKMKEPILFTHHDQPEPEDFKNIDMKDTEQYCISDVIRLFDLDGKGVAERLLSGVQSRKAMNLH